MNKKLITVLGILMVVIAAVIVYYFFLKHDNKQHHEGIKNEEAVESLKIYIPNSNSLLTKEILIQKDVSELKNVEKILESFLSELPFPHKETKILGIYRDKENIVYIDLSKNFTTSQSMREEYLILKSFYKTLKENFPWIEDINILIEGKEVENLSGHISIELSLKEALEEN